ncbi:DUF4190 domain-containing protein [Desulfovibrio sp. OttesenSCG-928-C14]|nr:DUF4190 domain-containing protein [Desulfovibrio sp. OttesenSCG-928-C14]
MNCPFCKEDIAEGAIKCKHCGSMLVPVQGSSHHYQDSSTPIWTSITSLVLGVLAGVTGLGTDWFDRDTATGMLLVGVLAVIFGGISIGKKHRCKGMAIAGLITGIIGILCFFSIEWL